MQPQPTRLPAPLSWCLSLLSQEGCLALLSLFPLRSILIWPFQQQFCANGCLYSVPSDKSMTCKPSFLLACCSYWDHSISSQLTWQNILPEGWSMLYPRFSTAVQRWWHNALRVPCLFKIISKLIYGYNISSNIFPFVGNHALKIARQSYCGSSSTRSTLKMDRQGSGQASILIPNKQSTSHAEIKENIPMESQHFLEVPHGAADNASTGLQHFQSP